MDKPPRKLHLGCGRTLLPDCVNVDSVEAPGVVVADLDACATWPLPFEDGAFDQVIAIHLLEHIRNPLPLMQELYRVCTDGARMIVRVPYGSSDDAFEDPGHVRQYFTQSFGYFSQPFYWRADYGYRGDWRTDRIALRVDAKRYSGVLRDDVLRDVYSLRNVVAEMAAELVAVKPARPPERELRDRPRLEVELVGIA